MSRPEFTEPRPMLEHCIEFSDVMDAASLEIGIQLMRIEAAELLSLLPYDLDGEMEQDYRLTVAAIDLMSSRLREGAEQ